MNEAIWTNLETGVRLSPHPPIYMNKIVKLYPHYNPEGYWKRKFENLRADMQAEGLSGFHVTWTESGAQQDEESKYRDMFIILIRLKNGEFDG